MKNRSFLHLLMVATLLVPTGRASAANNTSKNNCGCGVKQALATEEPGQKKDQQVELAGCQTCAPEPAGCDAPGGPSPAASLGCDAAGSDKCCDAGCDKGCDAPGCHKGCDAPGCDCSAAACDAVADACDAKPCTGQCGCDCVRCCNEWSVFAGTIFLNRSDNGNYPLITNQNVGTPLVNTRDLNSGTAAAPMVSLIRSYCDCWGWDIGYFGTDSWSTTARGGGNVSPTLNGPGLPFPSTQPGTIMQADYSSQLYSAEFNVRRRCNQHITTLAGFRWVEFGDTLTAYTVAPAVSNLLAVDTTNQMYGFQIGADTVLAQRNRARVDAIVRAGVLGNHIDHRASSPLTGNFGTVGRVFAEDNTTAFLGILGFRGVLPVSNCWSAFGGYQMMWLDGVALAADNINGTSLLGAGSANINTNTVFFHGAMVGLQASF